MAVVKGGVRIDGLNALVRDLEKAGVYVTDLKRTFRDIARDAAVIAARWAPKDSGALRKSIRGSSRTKNRAVVTAGRAKVPYAGAINYGWPARGIKPSSFMQTAHLQMRPRAARDLLKAVDKLLRARHLG